MKPILLFLIFSWLLLGSAFAQPHPNKVPQNSISPTDFAALGRAEDTLRHYTALMLLDTLVAFNTDTTLSSVSGDAEASRPDTRAARAAWRLRQHTLDSTSQIIRTDAGANVARIMRRMLRYKKSFAYPFDSTPQISRIQPADASFRILTWQVFVNASTYLYGGVIQFANGKTVWLTDKAADIKRPQSARLNAAKWFGALYYALHEYKSNGKKYYLLFGYNADTYYNHSKIVDVLTLDGSNNPTFGAPLFDRRTPEDKKRLEARPKTAAFFLEAEPEQRFILNYTPQSSATLHYDKELEMITFDHVVSMGAVAGGGIQYTPDGDVDGFRLNKNGKWEFVERIFRQISEEAPRPVPILDSRKDGLFEKPKTTTRKP